MTALESGALYAELERLSRAAGVRVAVATQENDGLVLHAAGSDPARAPAAAALGAALFARARAAAAAQDHGDVQFLRVQCAAGQLLAASAGGAIVVLIAAADSNAGRIRLELLRAAGEFS
ncbi:MAG TPA: roadblock/LC7 domain-containing protein [Gemmatimonadaceae bacterium]